MLAHRKRKAMPKSAPGTEDDTGTDDADMSQAAIELDPSMSAEEKDRIQKKLHQEKMQRERQQKMMQQQKEQKEQQRQQQEHLQEVQGGGQGQGGQQGQRKQKPQPAKDLTVADLYGEGKEYPEPFPAGERVNACSAWSEEKRREVICSEVKFTGAYDNTLLSPLVLLWAEMFDSMDASMTY